VIQTSFGDIDVELWAKETPKACRNFLQLCMEGYYNGTIFHRLIKDFMIQGGDPTGSGEGGASIYGMPFKDEIHSRIRFSRRGMLAMANSNEPNTNRSQFFITLGECPWLDRKHTIFGKVTGKTVFNLMRVNDFAVHEKDDRPVDPPRIISVEVLDCPFDDILPRQTKVSGRSAEEGGSERKGTKTKRKKKKKKKKKKNLNLVSFGEEAANEFGNTTLAGSGRMCSLHDAEDSARKSAAPALSSQGSSLSDDIKDLPPRAREKMVGDNDDVKDKEQKLRKAIRVAVDRGRGESVGNPTSSVEAMFFESEESARNARRSKEVETHTSVMRERMRERLRMQKRKLDANVRIDHHTRELDRDVKDDRSDRKKRRVGSSVAVSVSTGKKLAEEIREAADSKLLSPLEQMRQRFLNRSKKHGKRQKSTLAKLEAFRAKLGGQKNKKDKARTDVVAGDDDIDGDRGWMRHSLKFVKHFEDKLREGGRSVDNYVTIDPLKTRMRSKHRNGVASTESRSPAHLRGTGA